MKYYISSDLSLSMLSVRALKLFNFLQAKANRKTNSSFWSVPRMAQEMGLSERTVQRASQELVRKGFVEVIPRYDENGRQRSNIYKIVVPQELPHEDVYKRQDQRALNKNLISLVIGGSGSRKTRGYVMPNLLQCNSSFVVPDPKGELLRNTGGCLLYTSHEWCTAKKSLLF